MKTEYIPDPYNTPLYQATLIEQTQKVYTNTNLPNNPKHLNAQVQVTISLVKGGVELVHNKEVLHFKDTEDKICFQRGINAFFISLGFRLEQVMYPILIYKCATFKESKDYLVQTNDMYLSQSETKKLHQLILHQL